MRLTIQSTNLYQYNKAPLYTLRVVWNRVKPWKVDSAGIQEGGESYGILGKLFYYKRRSKKGTRYTQNNPILIKRGHRILWKRYWHAANGTGTKYTPPRNIFAVAYKKRGVRIVHINTHFHVVPEERLAKMKESQYPRAGTQYMHHVILLKSIMKDYKQKGYVVVVTLDGNTVSKNGVNWKYAAYKFLEFDSFKVHQHGVDVIVTDTQLMKNVEEKVVPREALGQADHDSVVLSGEVDRKRAVR